MHDIAHEQTEKEIARIERELKKEYAQAEREIQEKLDKYMERYRRNDEKYRRMVQNGEMSKQDYQRWRTGQIAIGRRWEDMRATIAQDLANTNHIARSIAQSHAPEVYALNHNFATYQIERDASVSTSYTLYSREAVERLMRDNPKMLPDPGKRTAERIRLGKDVKWNERQLQSVMMQGILQGESIPKLAKRLAKEVGEKNRKAAVRNARTMMTGAQNGGRMDAFRRAQDMGIDLNKRWLATHDGRTRHWHSELDEVSVPVDQPFVNEYGEIDYPGDSSADPANVYNCRCTLVADIKKIKSYSERLKESRAASKMSYKEWEKSHRLGASDFPGGNKTSVHRVGNMDASNEENVRARLREYESQIADADVENAYVVTQNGEIYHLVGDEKGVDIGALGGSLKGSYATHNHPEGQGEYTFSNRDVNTYVDGQMAVLRGFDEKYVYELNRSGAVDAIPTVGDAEMNIGEEYAHGKIAERAERLHIGYMREKRK